MYFTAILLCLAMTTGNFLFQALSGKENWNQAVDRIFSQIVAIIMFVVILSLKR